MDVKALAAAVYPDTQNYVVRMQNDDVFVGTVRVILDEVVNSLRMTVTGEYYPATPPPVPPVVPTVFTLSPDHVLALWPVPV